MSTEEEGGWDPEPVSALRRKKKLPLAGIEPRFLGCRLYTVIATLTEVPRLKVLYECVISVP